MPRRVTAWRGGAHLELSPSPQRVQPSALTHGRFRALRFGARPRSEHAPAAMASPSMPAAGAAVAPSLLDLDLPILVLIAKHLTLRELLSLEMARAPRSRQGPSGAVRRARLARQRRDPTHRRSRVARLLGVTRTCRCAEACRLAAQVCRRCVDVAWEPTLWRRLLRADFDLSYHAGPDGAHGADGARWRAAYREAHAAALGPASPLAFDGAYTDGGCDGDGRYTVDALFSPAQWEPYWCAIAVLCLICHMRHNAF